MEGEENGSPQPQQTKFCSNCKRDINAATFDLHESHCKRHITLCEICEEGVPNREKEQHFQENHAPVACAMCGKRVPKHKLEDHEDQCPLRRIQCKYCELDKKAMEYEEHLEMCGSRTDICDMCGERVMLKDLDEHQTLKCASVRAESPLDPNTVENLDYPQREYYGDDFGYVSYGDQYGHHGDGYRYYGNNYGHGHYGDGNNHYGDEHVYEPVQNGGESHSYPTDPQAPPPPYPGNDSIPVDPQWLETVTEACGEENLDHVLAQNMFYMNMRLVTARDEYQPIEREVVEEGVVADRQREQEQQQVHRDEDIARQLQHQYDNKRLEEERDAEMARQLQQKVGQPLNTPYNSNTLPQASDFERDAQLAERLQEEEEHFRERGLPTSSPPPCVVESDAELARRLQMEEDRNSAMKYKPPSDNFTYGGSHSHTPGSNIYQQENVVPSDTFPYESSYLPPAGANTYAPNNKPPVRYNDDTTEGGSYGYERSHPRPYRVHSDPYNPLYSDDEQPRAKTPPPTHRKISIKGLKGSKSEDLPYSGEEEKIPCQFCHKLIPFAQIMYHQKQCTADYYPTTTSSGHTEQYNVDELLRQNSFDEETSPANTIPCQFCGDPYTENLLVPHEALCEHNPDKHLKDAYRPERTPRPHPQPHPHKGPVREMAHSLQRRPLHAEEQDPEIPCEFCGEGFPSSIINIHQPTCTKNRDLRAQQKSLSTSSEFGAPTVSGSMASPEEVEMGPCEFCSQLLPITELIKHEATCQLQRSESHVSAIQSETSFRPPLELPTSTYKSSFDPTYIYRPPLQPMTSTHRPSLEPIAGSYMPSMEPATSAYRPSLQPTAASYVPSAKPTTPSLEPATSAYRPSLQPTAASYVPSAKPTTSSSRLLIAQPVKPPGTIKNGPQMAIRFPSSSQPSNTAGLSISPGVLKPAIPPYLARTTAVPKLQSINTTPSAIAAPVGVGCVYRPSAAAVRTTPTHTTSLPSTSIYKVPSPSVAVSSASSSRKRHISSTGPSQDLGSKIPKLVQAESSHYNSSLSSKLAAGTSSYGDHTQVSEFEVDPTGISAQLKYGTTAPRPGVHTPARSIPPSSQRQELGSAYVYQHPTASTNPLPPNQMLPSATNYNYLSPEISSMENRFLASAPQSTTSPTYPINTAELPSLSFSTTSSLQHHSPLSSSPTSNGSTTSGDDTPKLTPSLGSSQLPGGSLGNRGGGSSYKVNQYTKDVMKGGKGRGKGKHYNDVISSVSITRQSPDSPQSDGRMGDSSGSTAAQTTSFTAPLRYPQKEHVNVQSSTVLSSQLGTQRVQRETLNQNPSRGKETGLESDLANLKLSSVVPSNRSAKPASRSSQKSVGDPLQVPANHSSTSKPKKREEQSPNSASWQKTAQNSGKSASSGGATQKRSTPTQRSASQRKPMTSQPQNIGSSKSTSTSKGSPLPAESASRSARNPQPQPKTSRGGPKSGSRKPNSTSTTTAHRSPGSYPPEGVHGRPQTGRNTSHGATNLSTAKKTQVNARR